MFWANLLHIYQPSNQKKDILEKVIKESYQKIFSILEKNKDIKISLNINSCLTELLVKFGHKDIIERIKFLVARGQIELLGSAKYHPLLPLLPESEARRQIFLNETTNRKHFGSLWKPKGFFLPEMAYHKKSAKIIKDFGYQWIILDEIAYQGRLGKLSFEQGYQIRDLGLKVFFRNRKISDIFFTGWLKSPDNFFSALKNDSRCKQYLLTAMDGENLGHHVKDMDRIWENVCLDKKIKTLTYSELVDKYNIWKSVEPLPCSWSSSEKELEAKIPYALWKNPQNEIHSYLWELIQLISKLVEKSKKYPQYKRAGVLLDQNLNSDPFWWVSASPWWQKGLVKEYLANLKKIIEILKIVSLTEKKKAVDLSKKIKILLEQWEKSGKVEKIRRAYLKGENMERYFGGKKIK